MNRPALLLATTLAVLPAALPAGEPVAGIAMVPAEPVAGIAMVIDGETMIVGRREKVRLHGVAAPGDGAAQALAALADGKVVVCTPAAPRADGRLPARCRLGETDLAQWLRDHGVATCAGGC